MCNISNTRVRYENAAIFILLKSCIYSTLSLYVSLILSIIIPLSILCCVDKFTRTQLTFTRKL